MKIRILVVASLAIGTTAFGAAKQPLMFWNPVDVTLANVNVADAVVADFNSDGVEDLVTSTPVDGTLQVRLGDGHGGLSGPASYAVPQGGRGFVAAGDVNTDGHLDLVVGASSLATLLGNGDGTFQSPVLSTGSGDYLSLADFDRDGRLDVASIGRNYPTSGIPKTIDVYPGAGDGSFGSPLLVFASDNSPQAISVGDFNGDAWPDLVIPVTNSRALHLYLNVGAFTFTRSASAFIEVGPSETAVADLDGNGTDDVATANFQGSVSVLLGNGDGTLQEARTFTVDDDGCSSTAGDCPSTRALSLEDVNLDGRPDIVTANELPGGASVLLNRGAGTFGAPVVLPAGAHALFTSLADFDDDGSVDIAVIHTDAGFLDPGARVLSIYRNKLRVKGSGR
jgi:hypothetical protein